MKGHCVQEMPTGTGKTITLQSQILSYQYTHPEVGKIVYCTRTIQEMNKVVNELKNLMQYRKNEIEKDQEEIYELYNKNIQNDDDNNNNNDNIPKKLRSGNILGLCLSSRRNMCIHPYVSTFDHREKVDSQCRSMVASFSREKKLNALASRTNAATSANSINNMIKKNINDINEIILSPPDIEDFDSLGLCEYFEGFQRTGMDTTLNGIYSLDDIRTLGLERHWCPYYTVRRYISHANIIIYNYHYMQDPKIAGLISNEIEAQSIIIFDEAHNIDNICIEAQSITLNKPIIYTAGQNLNKLHKLVLDTEKENEKKLLQEYKQLVDGLIVANVQSKDTIDIVNNPTLPQDIQYDTIPGSIRKAKHFIIFLKTFVEFLKRRIDGKDVIQQTSQGFLGELENETKLFDLRALKFSFDRLNMLLRTLEIIDVDEFSNQLRICAFSTLVSTYDEGFIILFEPFDDSNLPDARLQLCCLDSSLAMKPIIERFSTVIITSGTLSPLSMYPKILGFEPIVSESFTMSLTRDIILPLIVIKGNDQNFINSSFSSREDKTVIINYGLQILSLSRTVPDGMVIFFTSYSYMEKILMEWNTIGQIENLIKEKLLFIETKDIEETELALAAYRRACYSGRGAIFFSVARGKVSEGIDFSGSLGRAVILIGVPYQYTRSRTLLARLQFLREKYNISESDFLHFDALRQSSQCVGRIIRSKSDYGVVIFADQRYSHNDLRIKLPRWVQQFLVPEHISLSIEGAIHVTRHFLKTMSKSYDMKNDIGKILLSSIDAQSLLGGYNEQYNISHMKHLTNVIKAQAIIDSTTFTNN